MAVYDVSYLPRSPSRPRYNRVFSGIATNASRELTSEHDPVRGRVVISSGFENAPFTLGPCDRQGPRLPHPADAVVAVVQDLRFDAPLPVIPQLARPGDVVLAKFPERLSRPGPDSGRRWDVTGGVEGVVSHAGQSTALRDRAGQTVWQFACNVLRTCGEEGCGDIRRPIRRGSHRGRMHGAHSEVSPRRRAPPSWQVSRGARSSKKESGYAPSSRSGRHQSVLSRQTIHRFPVIVIEREAARAPRPAASVVRQRLTSARPALRTHRLVAVQTLGLSIDQWVQRRLGGYVKLSVEERKQAAAELKDEGLSQRQIGSVLGVTQITVKRDLEPETNVSGDKRTPNGSSASSETNVSTPLDVMAGLAATDEVKRSADH